MFAVIHLKNEENYFVFVVDQNSNGLAYFLNFIEVAPQGDDVHWWCLRSPESFLGFKIISFEYLVPRHF